MGWKARVCIAYTSVYGNTEKAAERLAEQLKALGCPKIAMNNLALCDPAEAVEDAFRYGKLVLATTTYNADVFPFMKEFIHHLTERNFQNRTIGLMENGTWAPMAAKLMRAELESMKNITLCENVVTIRSAANAAAEAQMDALAAELVAKYRDIKSVERKHSRTFYKSPGVFFTAKIKPPAKPT